jgi:1-acyl-sn-glycerol-3-phosphate acyltransferase
MDNIFLVVFLLLVILNLSMDIKKIRTQHKSLKWLYISVYSLTSAIFICLLLGVKVPMPTRFFIDNVSPRVMNFILS